MPLRLRQTGLGLAETKEYDEIFAALKHPVRRQILIFLEQKGEASFTEIQEETGISDTGLMSYHLKELYALVEQSGRGKYCLSEVGLAGVALFHKVENERQKSSIVVHAEVEKLLGESIKKSVFFLLIAGLTLLIPMSLDINLAVQGVIVHGFSILQLAGLFLLSLLVMIAGVTLFTLYDRHYFSKNLKTSLSHSTIYGIGVSALSSLAFYSIYSFYQNSIVASLSANENFPLMFGFLRVAAFLVSTPAIVYIVNRVRVNRKRSALAVAKPE